MPQLKVVFMTPDKIWKKDCKPLNPKPLLNKKFGFFRNKFYF